MTGFIIEAFLSVEVRKGDCEKGIPNSVKKNCENYELSGSDFLRAFVYIHRHVDSEIHSRAWSDCVNAAAEARTELVLHALMASGVTGRLGRFNDRQHSGFRILVTSCFLFYFIVSFYFFPPVYEDR